MSVNNPARVTQSSQIEKCGYPTAFFSSDFLELGSIPTKVSYTPTMECSSNYTQNKTASIFRPWDSLNAVGTMTTSTTVEEEIFLESTEPTNIHIPADLLKDTEITEEPLNIGALHTFLKSEVRECDLQFVRVLEKSVIQAYESYKRYNRQSTATLEIPEFYTRSGEHMVEITPDSKIYFPKNIKQQIEEMSEGDNGCDWETIVRLSLKEVYDDNVGNYSAKGKATGSNTIAHPPIDTRLYNGIYKWVNQKVGNSKIITEKMFNKVINKFCLNKREIGSKENFDQSDMITDENLQFFRKLVKVIEESYDIQQREMLPERQTHQLSNLFTQPAKSKIKISPLYEIYLPKSTYTYVERSSETERGKYDWRILVKEALLEIYGDSLKNYSAKGRRGGSPGINTELYRALYDWASSLVNDEQITDADFVDNILRLTYNPPQTITKYIGRSVVR
ncbi:Protein of unknown function [Cotesia congregata]|uniref:Uncharacterized protein n=1 Tax=Cotesia congregata TaxID=51543 RepID=A0A8J2MLS0_COTCN|nr:Protein of unknown function [Cotesia congregata]